MTRQEYLELQEKMWGVIDSKVSSPNISIDFNDGVLGEMMSDMFVEALSGIDSDSAKIVFKDEE